MATQWEEAFRTTTRMSTGNPTRNPRSQYAPAGLPRFSVQPIHGIDFGTHVRLSFLHSCGKPVAFPGGGGTLET